jgi:cysteine-rich repeat protein
MTMFAPDPKIDAATPPPIDAGSTLPSNDGALDVSSPSVDAAELDLARDRATDPGPGDAARPRCRMDQQCPVWATTNECERSGCPRSGFCDFENLTQGTVSAVQIAADCRLQICDGQGHLVSLVDRSDSPAGGTCAAQVGCGDGVVAADETCDDGNAVPFDGCTACKVDAGFTCAGSPSRCVSRRFSVEGEMYDYVAFTGALVAPPSSGTFPLVVASPSIYLEGEPTICEWDGKPDVTGKIVLARMVAGCIAFNDVQNAQSRGAAGVVYFDPDRPESFGAMIGPVGDFSPNLTIPVVAIRRQDALSLLALARSKAVTLTWLPAAP